MDPQQGTEFDLLKILPSMLLQMTTTVINTKEDKKSKTMLINYCA